MILDAVQEARESGARLSRCAQVVRIDARTLQRWKRHPTGEDGRKGPNSAPHNQLSDNERKQVLALLTGAEFRDLSPKQIVPKLADRGIYIVELGHHVLEVARPGLLLLPLPDCRCPEPESRGVARGGS